MTDQADGSLGGCCHGSVGPGVPVTDGSMTVGPGEKGGGTGGWTDGWTGGDHGVSVGG